MTKREIAVLACRILAMVTFLYLLQASSGVLNYLAVVINPSLPSPMPPVGLTPLAPLSILLQLSPLALLAMFGLFLWTQADFIAAKMVGETDENMVKLPVNEAAQSLAFSVVGLFLLTQALPQIARMITSFLIINDQSPIMRREWNGLEAPDITFVMVQLALGLWLLFGSRGLITLLKKVRYAGRDAQSRQEAETPVIPFRPEN